MSRITVVTSGTKIIVDQIKAQLAKLIPVHNLVDITELKAYWKRVDFNKIDVNKQIIDLKKTRKIRW